MIYIGIDPGQSGAIAFVSDEWIEAIPFAKTTPRDISEVIHEVFKYEPDEQMHAFIEQVNAMPGQGVSSTFKFGVNYGLWQGLLTACGVPFERVTPAKWQTAMRCRSGGDKNITKRAAQELFPDLKIIHATADALLIAEYCRRTVASRDPES